MFFRIDSESGVPFYQQVTRQVKLMVASGALAPGDRLPTVRELAAELVLNPNTIARSYLDLEREGVVETRRGQGTFACAPTSRLADDERRRIVGKHLEHALVEAYNLNMEPAQVQEILSRLVSERKMPGGSSQSASVGRQAEKRLSKTDAREGAEP